MPEIFDKVFRRYSQDAIEVAVASIFVLSTLYIIREHVSVELLFRFSLLERVLGLVTVSFVVGKLANMIGNTIVKTIYWTVFQENRWNAVKEDFEDFRRISNAGVQPVELNEKLITPPEIFRYMGNSESIRSQFENLENTDVFWKTFLGLLFMLLLLPIGQSFFTYVYTTFAISILAALYTSYKCRRYWAHCGVNVLRIKSARVKPE